MMKQVVSCIESTQITPDQVNPEWFYGVEVSTSPVIQRGFIIRQEYQEGKYILVSFGRGMTYGNSWDTWNNIDLPTMVKGLIDSKKTVVQFNTALELYNWLGNGDFHN